jgi:hypothetical protein
MNLFSAALQTLSPPEYRSEDLRPFLSQPALRTLLTHRAAADEDFLRAEMLMIFATRTQYTWLLATNRALHCVIDNRRQPHARKIWTIPKQDIIADGRVTLPISEAALTERDSYVIIDGKRPRKFNRALFQTLDIQKSIEAMLSSAFKL